MHEELDRNTFMLGYGKNLAEIRVEEDVIHFANDSFTREAGQGAKFYKDMFNLGERLGKQVQPDGKLLDEAMYRYPMAIFKHKDAGKDISHILYDGKPLDDTSLQQLADKLLAEKKAQPSMKLSPANIAMLKKYATH